MKKPRVNFRLRSLLIAQLLLSVFGFAVSGDIGGRKIRVVCTRCGAVGEQRTVAYYGMRMECNYRVRASGVTRFLRERLRVACDAHTWHVAWVPPNGLVTECRCNFCGHGNPGEWAARFVELWESHDVGWVERWAAAEPELVRLWLAKALSEQCSDGRDLFVTFKKALEGGGTEEYVAPMRWGATHRSWESR